MQFEGFQSMVKTRLDKLSDLEAWPLVNGHLPGALLQQTKETTTRVSQLETRPLPPPPPPSFRMPPPRAPPRSHPSSPGVARSQHDASPVVAPVCVEL